MKKPRNPNRPPVSSPNSIPEWMGNQNIAPPSDNGAGKVAAWQVKQSFRQSPYPPIEDVRAYEEWSPGAFDRMLRMAEKQQEAQLDATLRSQTLLADDTKRGHLL